MGGTSIWHWIVVGLIVVLLFGRGKISDMMGDVAKGIGLQEGHVGGRYPGKAGSAVRAGSHHRPSERHDHHDRDDGSQGRLSFPVQPRLWLGSMREYLKGRFEAASCWT